MNLGFGQNLSMEQKLSYKMIQSLKLLQATTLELEQMISNEISENPLLEIDEENKIEQLKDEKDEVHNDDNGELEVNEDTIDVDDYLNDGFQYNYDSSSASSKSQETIDYQESLQTYQESLEEFLLKQVSERNIQDEEVELIVQYLVSSLDEKGYLPDDILEELPELFDVDENKVEEALEIVQSLEPDGVGARTLKECFQIQLRKMGWQESLAYRIISEKWKLFEKLKIPALARTFDVDKEDVQDAIDVIKKLDPKPGMLFSNNSSEKPIPDLIVENVDGELIVTLNDTFLPDIRINKEYANMLKREYKADKNVKSFIREKSNSANWLKNAIEQRKTTMIRVMEAIIEKQKDWFRYGPPNLAPLKLKDIAKMVGMHVSTISRVTNRKYVQTPFGMYELKYFFSESLGQDEKGEDISTATIKNKLKEMIDNEDKSKPLSDQKLSELMTEAGYKLARRTVAKYREQLGIPTARMRTKYD